MTAKPSARTDFLTFSPVPTRGEEERVECGSRERESSNNFPIKRRIKKECNKISHRTGWRARAYYKARKIWDIVSRGDTGCSHATWKGPHDIP